MFPPPWGRFQDRAVIESYTHATAASVIEMSATSHGIVYQDSDATQLALHSSWDLALPATKICTGFVQNSHSR